MPEDRVGAIRVHHAFTPSREEAEREAARASWAPQLPELRRFCGDARLLLLLRFPFFGHLALRLHWCFTETVSRWALRADGTIYFNPNYLGSLHAGQGAFILAHAVLHLAHGHFARFQDRDPRIWNAATDSSLATILRRTRLPPPPDFKERAAANESSFDLDAEFEYERMLALRKGGRRGPTLGAGPGSQAFPHETGDCDFGATLNLVALGFDPTESWKSWGRSARLSASRAKEAGKLSFGGERFLTPTGTPLLSWKTLLRQFVHQNLASHSNWFRPSRRACAVSDLVAYRTGVRTTLPGRTKRLAPVVIALDLSASISSEQANRMLSETRAILAVYRRPIRTLTFDVEVHEDREIRSVRDLKPKGGGGTSFIPLFERLDGDPKRQQRPACVVVFTDLYAHYPEESPPFPVVFVDVDGTFGTPPFGHLINATDTASRSTMP